MEIYRRAWIRNGLPQEEFDKAEDGLRIAMGEALITLESSLQMDTKEYPFPYYKNLMKP